MLKFRFGIASRFEVLGIQTHQNRSFYHPAAWLQHIKSFNLKWPRRFRALRIQNFKIDSPRKLKPLNRELDFKDPGAVLIPKPLNGQVIPNRSFYHLVKLTTGPRMLKFSNSTSWGQKTLNLKVLTSWNDIICQFGWTVKALIWDGPLVCKFLTSKHRNSSFYYPGDMVPGC